MILEWKSQELFQLVQNIFCSMKRKVFPLVIFCMAVNHSWLWLSTWKDNFCQSLSLLVFCFKYWTLSKDLKYFNWQNKNKHIWYNLSYLGIFETTFCNCELDVGSHHQQALISDSRSKHLTSNVFAVCSVLSCKCILVDFQNIIHLRPLYSRQNHSP